MAESIQRRERIKEKREKNKRSQELPGKIQSAFALAGRDFFIDNAPQWAASIAFYALLSLFPLILAVASIAAWFGDPTWVIEQAVTILGGLLPTGEQEVQDIVERAVETRETVGLISIAALLWAGTRVFGAMAQALNIAYDVDESYSFAKRLLVELVMFLTIGLFFAVALFSRSLIPYFWQALNFLPAGEGVVYEIVTFVLAFLLLVLAFFLIYRFVPRRTINWRPALAGALLAAVAYSISRPLFLSYLERFGEYDLIYGSVSIAVIIGFWAWIASLILLFGGEVAAHLHSIVIEGESPEVVKKHHLERMPTRLHEDDDE